MPIIKFINEKKEIQVPTGSNLRSEAMRAGVGLYPGIHQIPISAIAPAWAAVEHAGSITKGMDNVSPMGAMESVRLKKMSLAYIGNEDTMRLACQTLVQGDIEVQTKPPLNLFGENFFS